MNDTQSIWITGPIAVVGFVLMLVFLSGCASWDPGMEFQKWYMNRPQEMAK